MATEDLPSIGLPDTLDLASLTHEQKLALAVEASFAGSPIRKAARVLGVPHNTIIDWIRRDARYVRPPDRERLIAEAKNEAILLRREAAARMLEHMADEDAEASLGELNFAYGTPMDKTIKLEQLAQPQAQDGLSRVLAALGSSGGTLSVSVSPNAPAIDVTPQREENE